MSHHRPIERLLASARRDMREEFERGLAGMMEVPVALDNLVRTREELVAEIVGRMPDAHGGLLRSIARGAPGSGKGGGRPSGADPHAPEASTNLKVAFRSFMRPKGINRSCCRRPTTIPGRRRAQHGSDLRQTPLQWGHGGPSGEAPRRET